MKKLQHLAGVWQDCEICSEFTFTFRKKLHLYRKQLVPKFATSPRARTSAVSANKIVKYDNTQ